jgi:ribonucleoside-diphosphate reductase beta chain
MLQKNIFNTQKTDYNVPSLFLGENPGLFDTIHDHYPKITALFERLKSLDWSVKLFGDSFVSCNQEFKTCPRNIYDAMIRTLAWQWEADSIAARSIIGVSSNFISSSQLFEAYSQIQTNEVVHSRSYSEIVRMSFDNPADVFKDILAIQEALKRSKTITEVFNKAYITNQKLGLGLVENNQETYNDIFMFVVANNILETIQFPGSFAVSFAVADSGWFQPIGSCLQKINQDEVEVHARLGRVVLDYELTTDRGLMAFNQCRDKINAIYHEVIESEFAWNKDLFSNGRTVPNLNEELSNKYVLYTAKPIKDYFYIDSPYEAPKKNPIPFVEDWINVDRMQSAAQEERPISYLLNSLVKDVDDKPINIDLG